MGWDPPYTKIVSCTLNPMIQKKQSTKTKLDLLAKDNLSTSNKELKCNLHGDFQEIKHELESIKAFLKDADTRAVDEGEGGYAEGVKTWVKQLKEASFRIKVVIDCYNMYLVQRKNYSGCIAPIKKVSSVGEIKESSARYKFTTENGQGSSKGTTESEWFGDLRMASHFIKETQVVGFESPRDELVIS
ncbi:NBS-LRR resistance protein, putative [Medicago truncatula]|uniref:NBS-LRR resistance protein, putative n=1 Tax=Medicago truncatula TaxID=3880 RepID=G7I490_MEDTR|nr:NBS-LRR resistance protein, putative [Medicago truncatula]